jgi:transcriptional regulator with XRE-family HTH domain
LDKEKKGYPYSEFGKRIKKCREEINMDMETYSTITKINKASLYKYEQGKIFPPIDNFLKICKALDVTPSYLLLPLLELEPTDQDLVILWKRIKELRKNQEGWNLVKSMIMCIEIYLREQESAKG